jgi:DNA-binding transcriptional regulator LsrR (DeoR family)
MANVTFVGIGELGVDAPLCVDGFLAPDEMADLMASGASGEICGWMFDQAGRLLDDPINDRVASVPIPPRESGTVIGVALGKRKEIALAAALKGRLINGLITDEMTAGHMLAL